MSKFGEILKLLPKAIANPDKILEGWVNDLKLQKGNLPEDEIEEILRRKAICSACPFNSIQAKTSEEYFNITGKHYSTERTDLHCSSCSCNIDYKTSSLSSECGIYTLNENYPNQKTEPKWFPYKK
jgi:TPP-dependent indolepyruvate ferredoxin oxidoreductase alpha subunit